MISTQNLSLLPNIAALKSLSQSLALLDAILCPEWELRYYSFNAHWGDCEALASMRDGSGDDYHLLFTKAGAIVKGFAHESIMSPYAVNPPRLWPGVLDNVPETFSTFLQEPAFSLEDTTFCIWRREADTQWQHGTILFPSGEDPDGSAELLKLLDGNPLSYQTWAEEYYEQEVDINAITHIYQHLPLTKTIVKALNSEMSLKALQEDLKEIAYP